jgi:hypothetical protein
MTGLGKNPRCKASPAVTTPVTALVARALWVRQNGHDNPRNEKELHRRQGNSSK